MPFTPFHMGPGLLIKSILNTSFSLMIFGWAQILMDIQPLIVLISGHGHLHGFSHTFLGSLLIGIFAGVSGKIIIDLVFHNNIINLSRSQQWMIGLQHPIKWSVSMFSAYIGTLTHVLLDAIMHADVQPFYPVSLVNPMLQWVSVESLHKFCLYSGIISIIIYILTTMVYKKTRRAGKF